VGRGDHDAAMGMHRLDGADGFVVTDLDGLDQHAGVARCAPKVLADSAWLLARCATYLYASAGRAVGGASVGINAPADTRAEVLPAAVAALGALAAGGLALDAGKGLGDADLAPLHAVDGRPPVFQELRHGLTGAGVAAAIEAVRPLDGASVALESLDPVAVALADAVVRRGGRVVAVAAGSNAVSAPGGIDPVALAGALADGTLDGLGEPIDAAGVVGASVDVLAVGSKLGAIDHTTAPSVAASLVAPTGWVPVTTRALAVLSRADVVVLPDFVALAGAVPASGLGGAPSADPEADGMALVTTMVTESAAGIGDEAGNLVLAACVRAEAFLTAAGHELPPSRPLG